MTNNPWNKLTLKRRRDIISIVKQWYPLVGFIVSVAVIVAISYTID